jgi:ABC-type sugar transport system ATPase subunit
LPLALYHKPQNTFVAAFIGNPKMNFMEVIGKTTSSDGIGGTLTSGQDLTVKAGVSISMGLKRVDCQLFDDEGNDFQRLLLLEELEAVDIHNGQMPPDA